MPAPLRSLLSLCLPLAALLAACAGAGPTSRPSPSPESNPAAEEVVVPGTWLPRRGDEISVCGQLFHTGTPVVLWNDPGGYDAYRLERRFLTPEQVAERKLEENPGARYGARRDLPEGLADRVADHGWRLEDLQQVVHLFVLHYDVAGTSRQCFKILHDLRNLSVHFLLDVDGTIYQTLDLKERAWHATIANNHSVGIEIAHPGAYPQPGHPAMQRWYETDERGVRMKFPAFLGDDTGVRTEGYVPRPARPGPIAGSIHGRTYYQYDFTEEQYRALAHLTAALSRILPRIELRVPRDADGAVLATNLGAEDLHAFGGIVGHFHVQRNKQDPGPAFQWERLLRDARELLLPLGISSPPDND